MSATESVACYEATHLPKSTLREVWSDIVADGLRRSGGGLMIGNTLIHNSGMSAGDVLHEVKELVSENIVVA